MSLINFSPVAKKEDKLQDISDYLEELKHELGSVIEEYEDAVDGIFDVLEAE